MVRLTSCLGPKQLGTRTRRYKFLDLYGRRVQALRLVGFTHDRSCGSRPCLPHRGRIHAPHPETADPASEGGAQSARSVEIAPARVFMSPAGDFTEAIEQFIERVELRHALEEAHFNVGACAEPEGGSLEVDPAFTSLDPRFHPSAGHKPPELPSGTLPYMASRRSGIGRLVGESRRRPPSGGPLVRWRADGRSNYKVPGPEYGVNGLLLSYEDLRSIARTARAFGVGRAHRLRKGQL